MQALCAVHAAALRAMEGRFLTPAQLGTQDANSALYSMAVVLGMGPTVLGTDPALHRWFEQLWNKVQQVWL